MPTSNVLFDIELTRPDPRVFWVVSWLETLLVRVWYPTTVASRSFYCKRVILEALIESSDDPLAEIGVKLHDFGSRGVSSRESARIGGAAHLVNFLGSDTVEGAGGEPLLRDEGGDGRVLDSRRGALDDHHVGARARGLRVPELRPRVPRRSSAPPRSPEDRGVRLRQLRSLPRHRERLVRRAPRHDPGLRRQARRPPRLGRSGEREREVPPDHGAQDRHANQRQGVQGPPPVPGSHSGGRDQRRVDRRDPPRSPRAEVLRDEHRVRHGRRAPAAARSRHAAIRVQVRRRPREGWISVSKDPATDTGKRSKKGHLALVREGGRTRPCAGPERTTRSCPSTRTGGC